MVKVDDEIKAFAIDLFKINAVKFGEFKTKIGLMTPIYCNLRLLPEYPEIMSKLGDLLTRNCSNLYYDKICGVPYGAWPIASELSAKTKRPNILLRKEAKTHGTKDVIEGTHEGKTFLVIEDVVTSGSSILEAVANLKNNGIKVTDALVVLNRQQGGEKILADNGIKMNALLTLTELCDILHQEDLIDAKMLQKVKEYLETTKVSSIPKVISEDRLKLSYASRSKLCKNKIASRLFEIMHQKQSNLCVSADFNQTKDILKLAEQVGPYISLFKTHIDFVPVEDFTPNFIKSLKSIAINHNFIILEDRKFTDIGNTVKQQFTGSYNIKEWAHATTVNSLFGSGALDAIRAETADGEHGVFLLAEASASGCLINETYSQETIKMAEQYPDLVCGIVCQKPLFKNHSGFIQLTPGVQLDSIGDNLGQQYNSPEKVVGENGADIAVVGRGIIKSKDVVKSAKLYQKILWEAYLKRLE